jgi:hypothetical protein
MTQVLIAPTVIELVHKVTKADGIQAGLNITNKKNVILFDSSWIAAVKFMKKNKMKAYKNVML